MVLSAAGEFSSSLSDVESPYDTLGEAPTDLSDPACGSRIVRALAVWEMCKAHRIPSESPSQMTPQSRFKIAGCSMTKCIKTSRQMVLRHYLALSHLCMLDANA